MKNNLILDTCGLLWLASGNLKISNTTLKLIDEAEMVFVSAISAWEIALKQKKGELILPIPPIEWFEKAVEHHNLIVLPIDSITAIESVNLPDYHKDPADRFIISQALQNNLVVVTADEKFDRYGVKVII